MCYCICVFILIFFIHVFFFFKQKTAYEMRISDWSSDVCSSDLSTSSRAAFARHTIPMKSKNRSRYARTPRPSSYSRTSPCSRTRASSRRSEEHTSELQSLMRISYAVFCLKKKKNDNTQTQKHKATHKKNETSNIVC